MLCSCKAKLKKLKKEKSIKEEEDEDDEKIIFERNTNESKL